MKKKRKKRIRGRVTINWGRVGITLGLILIVVLIIVAIVPNKRNTVRSDRAELFISAKAVVIRDETAYYADFDFNNISIRADEGKKVSAGEELAVVYRLGYTEDVAQRLIDVQTEIYALQIKLLSGINNPDVTAAEQKIDALEKELSECGMGIGTRREYEIEHDLSAAVKARNDLLRVVVQPTEELNTLYAEETTRKKQLDEWTSGRVVSQEDGIFSCYSDGLETSLCMDKLDRISATQISSALSGSGYSTANSSENFMYRIVKDDAFCVAFITNEQSIPRVYSGENYSVTFEGFDMTYTGTCIHSELSGKKTVSVIKFNDDIGELLTRRTVRISVSAPFSGTSVLKKAIKFEDGKPYVKFITADGTQKIYVEVLATDKKYAIIRAADGQMSIDGLDYSS